MRFRLALAFSVSLLLIGAASWSRLAKADKPEPSIVAVEQKAAENKYISDVFNNTLEEDMATSSSVSTEPLTGTDLVGRQLIMDYLGLASNGQATEVNIAALADRYAESIPTLNSAPTVRYDEIKVVPNNQANFQHYAEEMTKIHGEYVSTMLEAAPNISDTSSSVSDFYPFAGTAHTIYSNTARKMAGISVPATLGEAHIKLVNIYLSSAAGMKALSLANTDSASAFAGLIVMSENNKEEKTLLDEIGRALESHGI